MVPSVSQDSQLWTDLPWKKFQRHLFGLQVRVYKAAKRKDIRKVVSLQKLIARSNSAKYLAIRKITQLNEGKKTPGIDGKASLNNKERLEVSKLLSKNLHDWRHSNLRAICIPKKDGSKRVLKIPTIKDRIWQCLAKFVLEPAHEASFHAHSYGCRPGRSAHDAQKILFLNMRSNSNGYTKRIIQLDIEKCFDRIRHEAIMKRIIAPTRIKLGIFRCLKRGVQAEFPEQGTPQGGVISPLLANIVLNGIEDIQTSIRYADDMVLILSPKDNQNDILKRVTNFLKEKGLAINNKKTNICNTKDGFDFLGWHFLCQKNNKFKTFPSKENFKSFKKKIKHIINSASMSVVDKVSKLAPIVRGWRNYHKFCSMSKSKFHLWGTKQKAFKKFKTGNRNKKLVAELIKKAFPDVPFSENMFVNVKGVKSPFDNDLTYWSARNSKLYDNMTTKILKKQKHSCSECGLVFMGEQRVHLHHEDGVHSNNNLRNLRAVHRSCHILLHSRKQLLKAGEKPSQ
jgi:RNA-directed DNA polymerase